MYPINILFENSMYWIIYTMDYEQPALLFLRGAFVRALAVPEPLVALPPP